MNEQHQILLKYLRKVAFPVLFCFTYLQYSGRLTVVRTGATALGLNIPQDTHNMQAFCIFNFTLENVFFTNMFGSNMPLF